MSRKTYVIIAIALGLMMFFSTTSLALKYARPPLGGLSLGSPYTATWEAIGNIDGTADAYAELIDASIEWVNPTGKSVNVGLGGEEGISVSSAANIEVDDTGKITIEAQFPYVVEHCREVPDCADLIKKYDPNYTPDPDSETPPAPADPMSEVYAFLDFYTDGADYITIEDFYKENWLPDRLIMLEVLLWSEITSDANQGTGNDNTLELASAVGVCIANRTYRTFEPPIVYICNEIGSPFGIEDYYVLKKDTFSGDVLENDFDRDELNNPDPSQMSVLLSQDPQYGDLTLNDDGTFTFNVTSDDFYASGDAFAYTPVDNYGNLGNETWVTLMPSK